MHDCIYMILSIHMGLVRHTSVFLKAIPNIESAMQQNLIELWCWFFAYGRHSQKQKIDSVILSSLTVWLLSFGPKLFSANRIAWFFNVKYL